MNSAACSCGQLQVRVEGDPMRIALCHCLACQRRTGAVISNQARFRRDQVAITGNSTKWMRKGPDHATHRFRGQRTRSAHLEHEAAKAELKSLVPADAQQAFGHGVPNVRGPVRSRGSSIQPWQPHWPRIKWWSTRGSRGGSDAAPTGPQASKSVRGVIGHQLNLTKMQL